jgi:hypothetical protein
MMRVMLYEANKAELKEFRDMLVAEVFQRAGRAIGYLYVRPGRPE